MGPWAVFIVLVLGAFLLVVSLVRWGHTVARASALEDRGTELILVPLPTAGHSIALHRYRPAVRRFGETGVMRVGLLSLAAGYALQALAPTMITFGAAIMLIPIGTALLFPASSSLVSRFAARHELGATMGVQQAYGGVARLVGPIWAGFTFEKYGPGAPLWISAGLALATLVFAGGLTADTPAQSAAPKAPASDTVEPEAAADGGA